jgi:adenosylcobinamide kinase/adenosylcobinamide-phosphate guanylyltransferase
MGRLTLVVGGARSGKSRHAEQLAAAHPAVIYLATAHAGDPEMAQRIARHRRRRAEQAPGWRTVEEPWDVAATVAAHDAADGCVLLECLTLWVTNLMLGLPGRQALADAEIDRQVERLIDVARAGAGRLIVVSNEVGCGIVPENALARRFGDVLGEANQRLAAVATEVVGCVAGIPVRIKGESGEG